MSQRVGDDLRELVQRSLVGKTGAEARATIEALSASTGLSVGHIYRLTAGLRPTRRATRKDAGKRRLAITDEQLMHVQNLTVQYDLAAERAIEIATLNGLMPEDGLKPTSYNRLLRQRSVTRKRMARDSEPTPMWEGRFPNDVHQFDATKLEHLHYDPVADQITYDPRRNYKNSRGEKASAVWLYLILDDFSRAEFAALYLDLNHYNHLDFIYRAWAQKPSPSEFPFYGVPRHIYMDKGGGNQTLKFLSALGSLGVHVIPTTPSSADPHGARKHGKVERCFQFYNAWESEFRMSRPLSWKEAEEFLYERLLWRNRRRHSETGEVPFQRWLRIDQPHHVPGAEFYKTLCYDRWTREVDNYLLISLDGEMYKLPEERPALNWIGEKVQVYAERGNRDHVIAVRDGRECVAHKVQRDNLVRPAFRYPRGPLEPTSIAEAREQAKATGTYGPMKLYESDSQTPAYLPRKGLEFDNEKIKLAGPPAEEAPPRPSPVKNYHLSYWLSRREVLSTLVALEVFDEGRRSEDDFALVDALMAGREKVEYDEVVEAAKRLKQNSKRGGVGDE